MAIHYRTAITAVGPEVAELLEGGVLILFAEGAPPELAEVSVLHRVAEGPSAAPPPVGARLSIGPLETRLTAIGHLAWAKVAEIGHVVIHFDGAREAHRPGEISAAPLDAAPLAKAVQPGAWVVIAT